MGQVKDTFPASDMTIPMCLFEGILGANCLTQFFAGGDLSRLQKGFDKFALTANGQAGQFLEPFAVRHFGLCVEPARQ